MTETYLPEEDGLFEALQPQASNLLRDRFQEPPFTVLDRRGGPWLDRDKRWKALGLQSELGRAGDVNFAPPQVTYKNWYDVKNVADAAMGKKLTDRELLDSPYADQLVYYRPEAADQGQQVGTSVFSPALCELVYRWYSAPGHRILDPFAGGSVRGVVAGAMARWYTGIELRAEQVEANRQQAHISGDVQPTWLHGDSASVLPDMADQGDYEADLIFSCPPYAYLEKYSDDPADLSNMAYPDFLDAYRRIIRDAVSMLRRDRFAAWVVGEVREKGGDGSCVGLVTDTIQAFRAAGADLYNDHIILTPIGTAAVRAPRGFSTTRKVARTHEYLLVFVKGDGRKAAEAARGDMDGDPTDGGDA